MDRIPVVFPVIHYQSPDQILRNAKIAFDTGCEGVFVIHMTELDCELTLEAAVFIKRHFPDKLVGVNFLSIPDMRKALWMSVEAGLDMTWTDEQLTHSSGDTWTEAAEIGNLYPDHLKFIGCGFKYQPREFNCELAARTAVEYGLIPTMSGPATGVPADTSHVKGVRYTLLPDAPLAIASGITSDNVTGYARHLSHILVSTGVSDSFYELSENKLTELRDVLAKDCWPYYTPQSDG